MFQNNYKGKRVCRICAKMHTKVSKIRRKYKLKYSEVQFINEIDIFIRQKWICQMCGCKVDLIKPTIKDNYANCDHIIPLSKGGKHILSNVQTLCRACNMKKTDLLPNQIMWLKNNNIEDAREWAKFAYELRNGGEDSLRYELRGISKSYGKIA